MATAAQKTSRRTKRYRERITEDVRLARAILPEGQARKGVFAAVDISNHSEDDQRRMVRSGERRTIRRKTKIDELKDRNVLTDHEALVCEWYARAHALRYDTSGITSNYSDGGRSGKTNYDHLPKTREQEDAFRNFAYAREGISPPLVPVFERVILKGWPIGKLGFLFRLAVNQLVCRIEGRL